MGAYSPAAVMTPAMIERTMREIIEPTVAAMQTRGTPFKGVLFAGLMITAEGPKLIEYNARFGDPETQVLMMRLKSDLLPALLAAVDGVLDRFDLRWHDDAALTVVLAANGYPGTPEVGTEIKGLEAAASRRWRADLPCRHAPRRRPSARPGRPRAQRHRARQNGRRGAGAGLCRRRPHRLAGRLLSPRHRLAGHRAREGERLASAMLPRHHQTAINFPL